MAELSEFLGAVVASVSNARMRSDLQTIKIAKEYAANDLLQHFAVPRMRFKDVEIKIPVAFDTQNRPHKIEHQIDRPWFKGSTIAQISKSLGGVAIEPKTATVLEKIIDEDIAIFETELKTEKTEVARSNFFDRTTSNVINELNPMLKSLIKPATFNQQVLKLRSEMVENFERLLKDHLVSMNVSAFAGLDMIIESNRLREIQAENMVTITMKVSEEGMEWQQMEDFEGKLIAKLLPE